MASITTRRLPINRLATIAAAAICGSLLSAPLVACDDAPATTAPAGKERKDHRSADGTPESATRRTEDKLSHAGGDDDKHDTKDDKKDDKKDGKHDHKDDSKDAGSGSGAAPAGAGSAGDDASKRAHGHDAADDQIVFYVSMHGAEGGNTVTGLTQKGVVKGSVLRGAPPGESGDTLKDLRGMCLLGDGSMLVVNAWMQDTRIIHFGAPGTDGVRNFAGVFIKGGTMNPAMQHTYSVVVGPDGSIYCSNQDSNTVTRYAGPGAQTPGAPLPPPPALANFGSLAPGTFIPNRKTSPDGLVEVRGIAFGPNGHLFVADRSASTVSAYDPETGKRIAVIASEKDGLKHPIQLAVSDDGHYLFIGDNGANCVWRKDLDGGALVQFVKPGTGGLDAPSAIVVQGDHLYVGNRKGKSILRFKMPEGQLDPHPFVEKLPDDPEFLMSLR